MLVDKLRSYDAAIKVTGKAYHQQTGRWLIYRAEAGPLIIYSGKQASFWSDLHGQTGETVGVSTIEIYFDFAHNKILLDVSAHQGNDFQINPAFWDHSNYVTAE